MQAAGQDADNEEALGFGDVILAGVLGLILGWPFIWFGLLLGHSARRTGRRHHGFVLDDLKTIQDGSLDGLYALWSLFHYQRISISYLCQRWIAPIIPK